MRKIHHLITTLIPILTLTLILLLAACGSYIIEEENPEIVLIYNPTSQPLYFTQATIRRTEDVRLEPTTEPFGRHISTTVNNRSYFFPNEDYEANTFFVYTTESIIYELKEINALGDVPIWIFYANDPARRHINLAGIAINHDDPTTIGWIVAASTGGYIPIWLATGIEAVARSNAGVFTPINVDMPDYFGDMHFQPAVWGSDDQLQSIHAAYHFAQYILESGHFAELFEMYLNGEVDLANDLANNLMYSFAGNRLDVRFLLNYFDAEGFGVLRNRIPRYSIHASTDMGIYRFLFENFDEHLSFETLVSYLEYSNDSIRFVKDWFAEITDFEWEPMVVDLVYGICNRGNHGYIGHNAEILHYRVGGRPPTSMAHEAVHLMSLRLGNYSFAIRMLEEGLAVALQYKHITYDWYNEGLKHKNTLYFQGNSEERYPNVARHFYGIFRNEEAASHAARIFLYDFNATRNKHWQAYYLLNISETGIGTGDLWDTTHPIAPELGSYTTAGSFVAFLIETYGAEKYLQVHHGTPLRDAAGNWTFSLFEDVYGITIGEMVQIWLEFLQGQIDVVLAMVGQ